MKPRRRRLNQIVSFVLLGIFLLASCEVIGGSGESGPKDASSNAAVEGVEITLLESFPVQVHVVAHGYLADGCTEVGMTTQHKDLDTNTLWVKIATTRDPDAVCTQATVPFEELIVLDVYGLPAGTYTVNVNGVTGTFTLSVDNKP
jgi:inhibitor of cysteine peptidase